MIYCLWRQEIGCFLKVLPFLLKEGDRCFSFHCFAVSSSQVHSDNNAAGHPCVPSCPHFEDRGPDTRSLYSQQYKQTSRFVPLIFFHLFFSLHALQLCFTLTHLLIYVLRFWKSLSENSDITVVCGTEYMDLSIYICPVYQALYNESLMVLNNQYNKPECFGMADWSVTPPVLKFRFPINESAIISCNNNFKVFLTTDLPSLLISGALYKDIPVRGCYNSTRSLVPGGKSCFDWLSASKNESGIKFKLIPVKYVLCFFSTDNRSCWDRTFCWLLKRAIRQHLRHHHLHGPLCRYDHLPATDPVQVLLPLPDAVPPEQHQTGRVSMTPTLHVKSAGLSYILNHPS